MQEYDDIRPYHDHEVPEVVERMLDNPDFSKAASHLVMPDILQGTPVGDWVTSFFLRLKTRNLRTIKDCQLFIADYFERLVMDTVEELTVSGLDALERDGVYLFMSNHRDIVLDSSLLNFLIHEAGHDTCRMAVGDNLLRNPLAADLMRLNKSFIVERSVSGARATLNALTKTSQYIRHSLEEGVSIWIAQREGRAKNGWDRTDPALLKMLGLAYKEFEEPVDGLIRHVQLVPVSISYELDPCALRKAHELQVIAEHGHYEKTEEEDVQSMVLGLVGQKGRVHLHFSPPVSGTMDSPDTLAGVIDQAVLKGMRIFPTHVEAARLLGDTVEGSADVPERANVMACFNQQLEACPENEREYLLLQYANVLRNRKALGIG